MCVFSAAFTVLRRCGQIIHKAQNTLPVAVNVDVVAAVVRETSS